MLLYVVDTGEGKGAITEAKNAIDSENESYAQKIADYDKQIKDLSEGGMTQKKITGRMKSRIQHMMSSS